MNEDREDDVDLVDLMVKMNDKIKDLQQQVNQLTSRCEDYELENANIERELNFMAMRIESLQYR